jgi:hypothetical protein
VGRGVWVAATVLATTSCISAEPIYLTASDRIEKYGLGEGYTFIAPYFTDVHTTLWISITKAAVSSNSAQDAQSKPAQPSIFYAGWKPTSDLAGAKTYEIRYAVSCDLSSVLKKDSSIEVSGIEPKDTYSGTKIVTRVEPDSVFVKADATQPKPTTAPVNGTLNSSCPALTSFAVSFGVTTTPKSRAYLYASRNVFFSDSINVSLDGNGMLSNSDSSSTQQITSILTELAQTAGIAISGLTGRGGYIADYIPKPASDPRQRCFAAIADLLKSGPYYVNYPLGTRWPRPDGFDSGVTLDFKLQSFAASTEHEPLQATAEVVGANGRPKTIKTHSGLLAFYPVPAKATLACIVNSAGKKDTVFLSAPSTVNLYTSSQYVDPQRDFLTGPQDTFSFSAGFIVGHKLIDQSSAKTVVDTIRSAW